MKPLVIIPSYLTKGDEVPVLGNAIASIRKTVSDTVEVLVVDDGSPYREGLVTLKGDYGRYDFDIHRKEENSGFSRTVNVGLVKARDQGREAILMNADIEMLTPGWLKRCRKTTGDADQPAAVVGGLLLYPNGLVQFGGTYFSLLTRTFDHTYRYAPGNLPEALQKRICPITGAFQYIRPGTLERVGLYDETFLMGWEDVDWCIRVFKENMQCVFNPNVRAYHFESYFRGNYHGSGVSEKVAKWQAYSFYRLCEKYHDQSFAGLVPHWD